MYTNKLLQFLEEQHELLQTPHKLSPEDKECIKEELQQLQRQLPQNSQHKKVYIPQRRKNRLYMIKDKKKHGYYHWQKSRAKKFLKKMASKKVRHSHLFSYKGAGYKKCFDLPWELW